MALQMLPAELLHAIAAQVTDEGDLSALCRTCGRLFHTLVAGLYRRNHLGSQPSALTWAIERRRWDTLHRATGCGVDIVRARHLTAAAGTRDVAMFKALWEAKAAHGGFGPLLLDEDRREPLYAAVASGQLEMVRMVVDSGTVDEQVRAAQQNVALYISAFNGSHAIVRLLLDHGAPAGADLNLISPLGAAVKPRSNWWVVKQFWGRALRKDSPAAIAETVRVLLDRGADVDAPATAEGDRAIHVASRAGWCEVVELLVARGADVDAPSPGSGSTPLHNATQKLGRLDMVQTLVRLGADVNALSRAGQTPLALTRDTREPAAVASFLLDSGARMAVDAEGNTPLHRLRNVCCSPDVPGGDSGAADLVEAMLARGADVDARNRQGKTPLHCVAEAAGHSHLIRLLVLRGASPEVRDAAGVTPLGFAAAHCSQAVVEFLIQRGADPNARTRDGLPLLQLAVGRESAALIDLLLSRGADVAAPNRHGRGALHYAALIGKTDMVDALLGRGGVSIDARDAHGLTPLMCAVEGVTSANFDFLLDRGAAVDERDSSGQTALHKAARHGKVRAATALLRRGARVNVADDEGQTPLHLAALHARPRVVEVLWRNGADLDLVDGRGQTAVGVGGMEMEVLLRRLQAEGQTLQT